ncbi:hypothetical protein ACM25N_03745 [Roseovarius sp. C7]|uniref:hypothetical protein n=1 Tax=Roseovarius sp. C7 TaxID=3398643 RepID=UPI0039F549D7
MSSHLENHQLPQSREGADLMAYVVMIVVFSVGFTVLVAFLSGAWHFPVGVIFAGGVLGVSVATAVMWRARKARQRRREAWLRDKAQLAEAEVARQLDEMHGKASNVPKVKR